MWLALITIAAILGFTLTSGSYSSIRAGWDDGAAGEIIYEDESQYNYIAVRQWGSERHLKLNDGVGIHSVYHPDTELSLGIWDYFLLAPLFNQRQETAPESALIIGSAAGTVSELVTNVYGPIPIVGVELDPQIIEVGQKYFGMNQPNLTPVAADGRAWLSQQPREAKWDLIAVDAYRPPYIPFHLTTVEFFGLVHSHLSDQGVLAINIGRTSRNFELVDRLAATVGAIFPSIYLIDEPGPEWDLGNTLLVATVNETSIENLSVNVERLPDAMPREIHEFAAKAVGQARVADIQKDWTPLTDDKAPIEQVVHRIILDFMVGN